MVCPTRGGPEGPGQGCRRRDIKVTVVSGLDRIRGTDAVVRSRRGAGVVRKGLEE